ncbi:hypothetical protein D3C77_545960 [compost metagenome]
MCQHTAINRTPDNACFQQSQQSVDEHFATAIQAVNERFDTTFTLDHCMPGLQVHRSQQCLVGLAFRLSRQERRRQGIAHGANANL